MQLVVNKMKINISYNQQEKRNTFINSRENKKLNEKVRIQIGTQWFEFKKKLFVVLGNVILKYFILEFLKHLKIDTIASVKLL